MVACEGRERRGRGEGGAEWARSEASPLRPPRAAAAAGVAPRSLLSNLGWAGDGGHAPQPLERPPASLPPFPPLRPPPPPRDLLKCVCVREKEGGGGEREGGREGGRERERQREIVRACMCMHMCMCVSGGPRRACVCVCRAGRAWFSRLSRSFRSPSAVSAAICSPAPRPLSSTPSELKAAICSPAPTPPHHARTLIHPLPFRPPPLPLTPSAPPPP